MLTRQLFVVTAVLGFLVCPGPAEAIGDEVRYYEKDGVTYRETRRIVQRPVRETRMQSSTETVYRDETSCEFRETYRTRWIPVTEYRYEPHLVGRWNPFVTPYLTSRLVPRTHWEQQTETISVPVTCRRLVPETRTVQVPVAVVRTVPEEVITRTAVGPAASAKLATLAAAPQTPKLARSEAVGGVARLDNDPPRQGVSTAWRASTTLR